MDIGLLYPLQCLDVMAGQTTFLRPSALFRFQPMIAPAMIKLNAHIVSFYVPYRLLWDKWNDFISGQIKEELPLTKIRIQGGFDVLNLNMEKTLFDYLGYPTSFRPITGAGANEKVDLNFNFFQFLAYHKIWDEHFRADDKIQPPLDLDDLYDKFIEGAIFDNTQTSEDKLNQRLQELYGLRRVNWGRDRFTSALLESQTDPAISLPVGSNGRPMEFYAQADSNRKASFQFATTSTDGTNQTRVVSNTHNVPAWSSLVYSGGLTGVDLSDFRLAMEMWNFKQNQNIFGSDVEAYFRKYGLRNMDARLQRSEVIGGYAETMQISDVIATSADDLGKQGGHAVGYAKKRTFKHYAPEHGIIMTMVWLRPQADYNGGIPRFGFKRDMLDFYQAEFNSGYQPIYKQEIGVDKAYTKLPVSENDMDIFGFEEKYNEYRWEPNITSGELRTGKPLSHWANPRVWSTEPVLNSNFLECNPSNQIWSAPNNDKAIVFFQRNVSKKCFVPPHAKIHFKF